MTQPPSKGRMNKTTQYNTHISNPSAGSKVTKEKPMGLKLRPLKMSFLAGNPSVNGKLLTNIPNKCKQPPTHKQASELGSYNKLSLWLSLKMKKVNNEQERDNQSKAEFN